MMKRRSLLLVALVLFSVSLFAAPIIVTWEWMHEDPLVTTFRYQVDGEDDDKWIVVDASVTSYEMKGLDSTKAYTLYLQQSYDGKNFSESSKEVASRMPLSEPKTTVADQSAELAATEAAAIEAAATEAAATELAATELAATELAATEAAATEAAATEAAATEAAATEAAATEAAATEAAAEKAAAEKAAAKKAKVKAESRYAKNITLGSGFSFTSDTVTTPPPTYEKWNIVMDLGMQFKNIVTFDTIAGFGVDLGIAYTPYLSTDLSVQRLAFTHAGTIFVAPMLNTQFNKISFDAGAGGFITYGPDFNSTQGKTYMAGLFAKLGMGYQINSTFSLGFDSKFSFVLTETSIPVLFDTKLYVGVSF